MVKVIQYRYYGQKNSKNYLPFTETDESTRARLGSENLFQNLRGEVIKLGIQASPGTAFYLNCDSSSGHILTVGYTGIYELDVEGLTTLTQLLFDPNSINATAGNGLIVDIVYKTLEGN